MKATLKRANDEKGYFMTDSSTWVAQKKDLPNLHVLYRGDKYLVNTYHTLSQPESETPGTKTAAKFIEFVASKKGQDIINNYGKDKYDESLYNDAAYAKKYDH
jgi:tungstate transport system substrate-binding protein